MGVMGAFIFAAQMINFTIPGTGSSGHLGGGMFLAILLGPHAAFLAMASVLTVQALFFADGGLLALGCNIFNLGFLPCFIAYPFIYKPLAGSRLSRGRMIAAAVVSAIAALSLGAFNVVLLTTASGISSLPFTPFFLMMMPVHLAIGLVEGLATAGIVSFIWQARPEILANRSVAEHGGWLSMKKLLVVLAVAAVCTGGFVSWFASGNPDGLEWSIEKVSGQEEPETPGRDLHVFMTLVQDTFSFLPDYGFRSSLDNKAVPAFNETVFPVNPDRSVAGLVGGLFTLIMVMVIGLLFTVQQRRQTDGDRDSAGD